MYRRAYPTRRVGGGGGGGCGGRLIFAAIIAAVSLFSYFGSRQDNAVTGETQYIDITVDQEIALGLQAAPQMAAEFDGLDANAADQAIVDDVGNAIVASSPAGQTPYEFDFHLLADTETINAFALPGGQVFITRALYDKFQTEGELAGVLGHEIAHVVARHSAEHIAKAKLTEGLTGAAVIATYDPQNPASAGSAQVAMLLGQLINLKFGRDDELESDFLGVCFMNDTGYNPQEMVRVMQVLAESRQGNQPPEFFSTHPNPEQRIERIQAAVQNVSACP
ncbi:MAG: M48 family metalloprotease [Chloroflexota bacterium]